ncbi:MAG TPA: helix-turn-helix transcriptional regulator [Polyangiaceae bacterium]|nr:helix-turn-helix transcriptional regulator [Polyangiaceae bacterium]
MRVRATEADTLASETAPVCSIWSELATGAVRAVDWFCGERRCYLVVRGRPPSPRRPPGLTARNLNVLRQTLGGPMHKVTAQDLGVTESALSFNAARCLRAMGFGCSASRVPAILVMAVRARIHPEWTLAARVVTFAHEGEEYRVYSVPRPDPATIDTLSSAEREVVRLVVERRSNAEIASLRSTSVRTVANQVNSVIHKLRVDGRKGILERLIALAVAS